MYAYGDKCVYVCMPICVCVYYGGFIKCLETPGGSGEGGVMNKELIQKERNN